MSAKGDSRPPNEPWKPMPQGEGGYLSFYYSDPLSKLAIREITRPGDNKSDPNLETGTFGLFSTCERQMRSGIIKNGTPYIFFVTNRAGRVLSGYYKVGWYSEGVLGAKQHDYALAAAEMHFLDPPIALSKLPMKARKEAQREFRTSLRVDKGVTEILLKTIRAKPNATPGYLEEIDRIEKFNQHVTGFRCWRRSLPFSWEDANKLLQSSSGQASRGNSSPTGLWLCTACKNEVRNRSLLKLCPFCDSAGTLEPVLESSLD